MAETSVKKRNFEAAFKLKVVSLEVLMTLPYKLSLMTFLEGRTLPGYESLGMLLLFTIDPTLPNNHNYCT